MVNLIVDRKSGYKASTGSVTTSVSDAQEKKIADAMAERVKTMGAKRGK